MIQFQAIKKYWDASNLMEESVRGQLPNDCFAFPGLINAHDHLEFNLFPPLANRVYADYIEWGEDIHSKNKAVIESVLQIPTEQRIRFGLLKNLVNGVTHVVHHGNNHNQITTLTNYPVWMDYQYLHSLRTDKKWKAKLNWPSRKELMVHIGEGTSPGANHEIDQVLKWNLIKKKLTGIHAIGLSEEQAKNFNAIVWCPASNLFLYNKTMQVDKVKDSTTILFGTDSTVSAPANLWEQLRTARALHTVSDEYLFKMLTQTACHHFYKKDYLNQDWVVAKSNVLPDWNAFYELNPKDIMQVTINNSAWLCDDSLPESLRPKETVPIQVGGTIKWVQKHLGEVVSMLEKQKISLPLGITSVR
jgi:hypothetical protein